MTGTYKVPTLFLDDGTIIDGTADIVAWAAANPTSGHPGNSLRAVESAGVATPADR
jgi:hypothetical protein